MPLEILVNYNGNDALDHVEFNLLKYVEKSIQEKQKYEINP